MDSEDTLEAPAKKVYCATLAKTRKAINTALNAYRANPDADTARFRAQVYAMKTIAEVFKMEKDLTIQERLDAIERELDRRLR